MEEILKSIESEVNSIKKQQEELGILTNNSKKVQDELNKLQQERDSISDRESGFYKDVEEKIAKKDKEFRQENVKRMTKDREINELILEKKGLIIKQLEESKKYVDENRNVDLQGKELGKLKEERKKCEEEIKLNSTTREEFEKMSNSEKQQVRKAKTNYLNNKHRLNEIIPVIELMEFLDGKDPKDKFMEIQELIGTVESKFNRDGLDEITEIIGRDKKQEEIEIQKDVEEDANKELENEESIEDILMDAYEKSAKEAMERQKEVEEEIEIQREIEEEDKKQPPAVVPPRNSEKQPPAVIPPKAPEKQKPQFIFDRKAHLYILIDEYGRAKGVNVFKKNEAGKYENTLNDEFIRTARKSLEAKGLTKTQIKSVDMNLLKTMSSLGRGDLYESYIEGIKNGKDLKFDLIYLMGKGKEDDISKKDIRSILNVARRQEKLGIATLKEDKKEKHKFRFRDIPKRIKAALAVIGLGTGMLLAANSQETKIPENPKEITTEDTHDALENKKQEQKAPSKDVINNQKKAYEERKNAENNNLENKEETEKDTVKDFKDSYKVDQKEEQKDTNTNEQPASQAQPSNNDIKVEVEGKIGLEDRAEYIGDEEYTFQKDSGELQPSKKDEVENDFSKDRERHVFEDIIMREPDPKYNEELQESLMEEYEQGAKEAMERQQDVEEAMEIQREVEEEEER